jgi:hypothetical protein
MQMNESFVAIWVAVSDRTWPCSTRTQTVLQQEIHYMAQVVGLALTVLCHYGTAIPVHGTGGNPNAFNEILKIIVV